MSFRERAISRLIKLTAAAITLAIAGVVAPALALAEAEAPFDGPKFKRGLWRFDRTLAYRDTVRSGGTTRCVDPTSAMKGIFTSPDIGNCRSARAIRVANRYQFENRCDYMGPVRTLITVHSDEAYTELNIPKNNHSRPVDKVVAHRVGDCDAEE
jgi:hypothetical protein